jgi:transcriptional regulator with XRE-family HTH domain
MHLDKMSGNTDRTERPEVDYRIYNASAIGAAIKDLRRARGVSQASLAMAVGINRTYLSNLEQGRFSEQLERLFAILKHLGTQVTLTLNDE